MPKALLLPSYLGGGYGHIGRCQALAVALAARGWETALMLGGPHQERVGATQRVFPLLRPGRAQVSREPSPAFTIISDFSYQIVRDGLVNPAAIRASVAEQSGVIRRFQPDLLIADTWPLAGVLAQLGGLPLVQITRAIVHPQAPNLIWWQPQPDGLKPPDPRPIMNPLLQQWKLATIERAEDLLKGNLYLVPSIPQLDPLPDGLANTHYVGPLVRQSEEDPPAWFDQLNPALPLIYVTTGGGADSVGGLSFYRTLIEALKDVPVQVVISTGSKVSPADLPGAPLNIRLESWVPGPAVIARSSLVVFSGGYGTTMEIVRAGVPGLVIPFHTEQESNARRLEAAGAATVLLPSEAPPVPVWREWAGGRFSFLIRPQVDLTPERVRMAILDALESSGLRQGVKQLQEAVARYSGPMEAAEWVEKLLTSEPRTQPGWDRLAWWHKWRLQRS